MAKATGDTQMALVVKTVDRLANVQACVTDGNQRLLNIYRAEHPTFKNQYTGRIYVMLFGKNWML